MRTFDSLGSWANTEMPSTPSYAAIGRYFARNRTPVVLPFVGVMLAMWLAIGQYAVAVLVAGTLLACAVAVVAGVAVAFEDAGVAVVATAATAAVLAATVVAVRALGLGDDQLLGIVIALSVVPGALAGGTLGYTVAERAKA